MSEEARQAHLEKYGSFLYCPERDTLCAFIEHSWETGCPRDGCILDDPEYQALVKKQEENRSKQLERERKRREDEAAAAKVINQQNMIQNYVNKQLAEIHRLEEASQRAYPRNQPRRGDELFGKARIMRGELRQYMREHGMR